MFYSLYDNGVCGKAYAESLHPFDAGALQKVPVREDFFQILPCAVQTGFDGAQLQTQQFGNL